MAPTLIEIAVVATGLVTLGLAEPLMRHPEARDLATTPFDHGTTALVLGLGLGSIVLAICIRAVGLRFGSAPTAPVSWVLVVVIFLGAGLRYWSMAVLGPLFTRTLRLAPGHQLVRSGPYRFLRHPGYLANLLGYVPAITLITASWRCGAIVLVSIGCAYAYRIHHEERMLVAALGEPYRVYQDHTHRLVPWIY